MRTSDKTFGRARKLRRQMSLPEIVLWQALRKRGQSGLRFRRQHPLGPYILDFYCPAARLAIEVDGRVHDSPAQADHDERRQAWLGKQGVRVWRVLASDILKEETLGAVLIGIEQAAAAAPSGSLRSPPPP